MYKQPANYLTPPNQNQMMYQAGRFDNTQYTYNNPGTIRNEASYMSSGRDVNLDVSTKKFW